MYLFLFLSHELLQMQDFMPGFMPGNKYWSKKMFPTNLDAVARVFLITQ